MQLAHERNLRVAEQYGLFEKSPASPTDVQLHDDGRRMSSTIVGMVERDPGMVDPALLREQHASILRREEALEIDKQRLHEEKAAMREEKAFLERDKQRLDDERASLRERERKLDERERQLVERETRSLNKAMPEAADAPEKAHEPEHATKKSRKADPIDDVPALVDSYQVMGGVVPLGVLVAEVEALQQAAARHKAMAEAFDIQLAQLAERLKLDMPPWRRKGTENSIERLRQSKESAVKAEAELHHRYSSLRDKAVTRFTPLLLQTVNKYSAAFEGVMDATGEASLERIETMCKGYTTKGRRLRQPLVSAHPKESLDALMLLMDLAIQAGPKLATLARDAIGGLDGCEVVVAPKPTKGLARALQKAQEEYESDYTRILDLARISIVITTLHVLEAVLAWLLAPERSPRFRVARIKDRLSRQWDAEMSGGNRDLMLNGWLDIGGGRQLIVEVQLHLRCLYELKSDLHVLYAGARVLGALEDSTAKHEGVLSEAVLQRMETGVVRKVGTMFTPMDEATRARLVAALHTEPCALLELQLNYAKCEGEPCFEGWTIPKLIEPSTGTLACRRLRVLEIAYTNMSGEIPPSLADCSMLTHLHIMDNQCVARMHAPPARPLRAQRGCSFALVTGRLTGSIPDWLPKLPVLQYIGVGGNKLTGPIPESIGECRNLTWFNFMNNMLSGQVPADALMKCPKLIGFEMGSHTASSEHVTSWTEWMKQYKVKTGHMQWHIDGQLNKDLTITAMGKAMLMPIIMKHLKQHKGDGFDEVAFIADPDQSAQIFPKVMG